MWTGRFGASDQTARGGQVEATSVHDLAILTLANRMPVDNTDALVSTVELLAERAGRGHLLIIVN